MNVKVEINTFERSPARPAVTRDYAVDSPWWSGAAAVPTFEVADLTATKIRALFQRKKGRDLFDLWLAVEHVGVVTSDIAACFEPYRPEGWSVDRAIENLSAKCGNPRFTTDLDALVAVWPERYSIDAAAVLAAKIIQQA